MNKAEGEHYCQLLWVGSRSTEISSHAIPSWEQDLRPQATLGSTWVPVAVEAEASSVDQADD